MIDLRSSPIPTSIHIQAVDRLSLRISNRLGVCGSFGLSPHEGGRGEGGADEEGEESHNGSRGCNTRSRLTHCRYPEDYYTKGQPGFPSQP